MLISSTLSQFHEATNPGPAPTGDKSATKKIPSMDEWGTEPGQFWNDACEASDCDECEDADVMMCYSCNVVMHGSCATRKDQNVEVADEWLCGPCHADYQAKL